MVWVYSHTASPRLQYVLQFLSGYYKQPFELITEKERFLSNPNFKINYTKEPLPDSFHIAPVGLLFEKNIHPVAVNCFTTSAGYKALFPTTEDNIGFDLFAALFYLLSRYEEYLPHQKDSYGRYAHQNSTAWKNDFLQLPLINIWLDHFRNVLLQFSSERPALPLFRFLPTYDIDMAWSYCHKGFLRHAGGILKAVINKQWTGVRDRIKVLSGSAKDPFDCYEWLHQLHTAHALKPLYFFHVGQRKGTYDKNISTRSKAFQTLVKQIASHYTIGLHPSWQSGDEPFRLPQEKNVLETIIQRPVSLSRQHYIRFTLPQTFRQLIATGITDDYSMGYGSINGFRASVAASFYWYDLEKEKQTSLLLHPFCFMDANAFYEQQLSPDEAAAELDHYYNEVKKVKGTLITIWHNNILGTDTAFKGWKELYQNFIETLAATNSF